MRVKYLVAVLATLAVGAGSLAMDFVPEVGAGAAVTADSKDPRAIMKAVEARDTGDRMTATMKMKTTSGSGRTRERSLRVRSLKFDGGEKQIMFFESPADVRNTGLLSVDYDASDKSDDQWLYLPSLRKTTRISGGSKSGSFMGSDFSYSDMTKRHTEHYDYTMVKQDAVVAGEPCWLIEARPRTDSAKKETGYVKLHSWVSKKKLLVVQAKAWIRRGKKLKYIKFDKIEKIDGVWVARKLAARTARNEKVESTTVIDLVNVRLNEKSITPGDFTQRRLEQGL